MAYLICLLLILCISALLIALFPKRRFEELAPAALFIAILTLYIGGLFGSLRVGYVALLVVACAGALAFLLHTLLGRDRDALCRLFTPGFAAYLIMAAAAYLLTCGLGAIVDNDGFDHWALVVKNMFLLDALGNAAGSTAVFQTYPPAVSLLQYLLMRLGNAYVQHLLYAGVALFSVTICAPALKRVQWRRPIQGLCVLLLIILLPAVVYNRHYGTLLVDALLALLAALMLYVYFDADETDLRYQCTMLALNGSVLSLTKAFGAVLLGVVGAIVLVDFLLFRRKRLLMQFGSKRLVRAALLTALLAAMGQLSWLIYTSLTPTYTIAQSAGGLISGIRAFLASPGAFFAGYRKEVLFSFVNELLSGVGYRFVRFSYVGWALLLLAPNILLYRKADQERKSGYLTLTIGLAAGFLVYVAALLLCYLTTFEPRRALMLGSFERYVFTYLLFMLAVSAFIWLSGAFSRLKPSLLALVMCLILPFMPVRDLVSVAVQGGEQVMQEAPLTHTARLYEQLPAEDVQLGYISADQAYSYWGVRYYATPVRMSYFDIDAHLAAMHEAGVWDAETIAGTMLGDLRKEGCTHLYIQQCDARISALIDAVCPQAGTAADYALYRIAARDGSDALIPAPYAG